MCNTKGNTLNCSRNEVYKEFIITFKTKHRWFITLHYNICAPSIPALSVLLCMFTLG